MLDNTPNQPSKSKIKNCVEINDESREMCDKDNKIRFKISILRSCLSDFRDAYILIKKTMTVAKTAADDVVNKAANKDKYLKVVLHLLIA